MFKLTETNIEKAIKDTFKEHGIIDNDALLMGLLSAALVDVVDHMSSTAAFLNSKIFEWVILQNKDISVSGDRLSIMASQLALRLIPLTSIGESAQGFEEKLRKYRGKGMLGYTEFLMEMLKDAQGSQAEGKDSGDRFR